MVLISLPPLPISSPCLIRAVFTDAVYLRVYLMLISQPFPNACIHGKYQREKNYGNGMIAPKRGRYYSFLTSFLYFVINTLVFFFHYVPFIFLDALHNSTSLCHLLSLGPTCCLTLRHYSIMWYFLLNIGACCPIIIITIMILIMMSIKS